MKRAINKYRKDFLAVVGVMVLSIGVLGYIISQQEARPRIPLVEGKPFKLQIELADARAVVPGQGQEIVVAGVQIGKVGSVYLQQGKGIVRADLDPKYKGLVRENATAMLRPKTGLKDMFVDIDPGSKSARPLDEMERIPVGNTAPDVDPDEFLAALDSDTRAYLQLLINGGGKGLQNHGNDLREVFRRLEPLHRDLARVTEAVAERRRNLRTLIHNYGSLMTRLGRSDDDLRRLVAASNRTLNAFASENQNLSAAVRELSPTLNQTSSTLVKAGRFGRELGPTLEALRPAFRQLDDTNAELRPLAVEGTPIVRDRVRPFVRRARPYVRELRPAAVDLNTVSSDLRKSMLGVNRFFNIAAYNKGGAQPPGGPGEAREESYLYWLAWTANNGVSTFSTSDASGPFRRAGSFFSCSSLAAIVNVEGQLAPVAFGLGLLRDTAGGVAGSPALNELCPDGAASAEGNRQRRTGQNKQRNEVVPAQSEAARGEQGAGSPGGEAAGGRTAREPQRNVRPMPSVEERGK